MSKNLWIIVSTVFIVGCSKSGHDEGEGKYIVAFKKRASIQSQQRVAQEIEDEHGLNAPVKEFSVVIQGGVYDLDEEQIESLSEDPDIAYIEKDQKISIYSSQSSPPWGLDRIDQADLPLNQTYNYQLGTAEVHAYVIDTGILASHSEFEGRVSGGIDIQGKDSDPTDCEGHGTHVAGTIGSLTYGVAKNVKLHPVRVLDCQGSGSYSDVIAGIEWVTANHVKPAVANMSLGGPISKAIDDAVQASIAAGVIYVVAAGNENSNACGVSPSRVPEAITVGSTTKTDARSSFSNFGSCVDVFAPGSDILSLSLSRGGTATLSGTSMASPHVAGVVALYLSSHPDATAQQVSESLIAGALSGKLTQIGSGSPNLLLNTAFVSGEDSGGGGEPAPENSELKNGEMRSGLAGARGDEKFFSIVIPEGARNLVVEILGGSGDADLYVRAGAKPGVRDYDCRPYRSGNSERCVVADPKPGVIHILLRAYSNYSDVKLKVSFDSGSGNVCAGCTKFTGTLAQKGAFQFNPDEYQTPAGAQEFTLSGPEGTDFDIYLYKKNGNSWIEVARSNGLDSNEEIIYHGQAGSYRLKVVSYSGSGAYELVKK